MMQIEGKHFILTERGRAVTLQLKQWTETERGDIVVTPEMVGGEVGYCMRELIEDLEDLQRRWAARVR